MYFKLHAKISYVWSLITLHRYDPLNLSFLRAFHSCICFFQTQCSVDMVSICHNPICKCWPCMTSTCCTRSMPDKACMPCSYWEPADCLPRASYALMESAVSVRNVTPSFSYKFCNCKIQTIPSFILWKWYMGFLEAGLR